jgi:hypothetical protein
LAYRRPKRKIPTFYAAKVSGWLRAKKWVPLTRVGLDGGPDAAGTAANAIPMTFAGNLHFTGK